MFKRKRNAFTLIELVAILVIMAIIALIVTPLVMSIIRKARVSADKRSIDAYGRSIELAIASYLMDTGSFPTSVDQLIIEYSGDKVECETTQINSDSSIYLAGCTVVERSVGDYTYGKEETVTYKSYSIGDQVTYNNVDYYVIKDSDITQSTVTMLKAEPLTVDEVNTYGAGHINRYTYDSVGTAYNRNGYGGMVYYSSETCGYVNGSYVDTGCKTDYATSEVKYAVDAWKVANAPGASEARLITFEDLMGDLGFKFQQVNPTSQGYKYTESTPSWVYNCIYYWTMSSYNDSASSVWYIEDNGTLGYDSVYSDRGGAQTGVVRPVVELYKNDGITRKNNGNN